MKVRKIQNVVIVMVVAALALSATPISAQLAWQSYAAKFVCNVEGKDDSVLVGRYATMVNIHNPHYLMDVTGAPIPLTFFKKVVMAKPQGDPPLPPTCKQQEFLPADGALGVNCSNIKTLLALSGQPTIGDLEGFVVIEVPPQSISEQVIPPLDVTVVYTARPRKGTDPDVKRYDVRALDVERVPATEIIGIPDQNPCPPPRP